MILVALVIYMIEGEMLFVVCQLRRDVIGCNDCKKMIPALRFVYCKWKVCWPIVSKISQFV